MLLALLWAMPFVTFSQCIVINELIINGASGFDGQSAPNTEEWIELYNNCDEPVDISCWALADGDFVIRFPQGTVIQPYDFFVIGSDNSGVPIDLAPADCNCATPGSETIIFSNNGEQLVLINNAGSIQDAVIWGGGQNIPFAVNNSSGGCNNITTQVTNNSAQFESLPYISGTAAEGCTYARSCDGGPTWELRCGSEISAGEPNGPTVTLDFEAESTVICVGDCIDFVELCEGNITSYEWLFEGGQPATLFGPNVSACYNTPGSFSVTLIVESECGSQSIETINYITVVDDSAPLIIGGEDGTYCEGESVILSTTAIGDVQWLLNNQIIPGANSNSYSASVAGDYTVQTSTAGCIATSEIVSLFFSPNEPITITASGPTALCPGESVTLNTTFQGPYQWLNSNQAINGATNSTLTVSAGGIYSLAPPIDGCFEDSNEIEVISLSEAVVSITAASNTICPNETLTLQVENTFDSYTWYLDNVIISGENNSSLQIDAEGTYSVVTTLNGCELPTASIAISLGISPSVSLSTNTTLPACPESIIPISATGSFASIQWFVGNTALPETANTINANVAGDYSVLVQSMDGCSTISNILSVIFLDEQNPEIVSSQGLSICSNSFTDLSIPSTFSNYEWTQNAIVLNENGAVLAQVTPGNYSVTAVNSDGCLVNASITITSTPLPNVIIQPNGNVVTCEDSFTFTAVGANSYAWYYNDVLIISNSNSLEATEAGSYYAIGTTGNCSSQSSTVDLTFQEDIQVEISASDTVVCEGGEIVLAVPPTFVSYLWSNGAQTPSTAIDMTSEVTVNVIDSNGCRGEAEINIEVIANPEIELLSNFESDCVRGSIVKVESNGLISWQLSPYLTIIDSATALYNPPFSTDFIISSSIGDCRSEERFRISAECTTLFVPNTITPNGDGVNDVFLVEAEGIKTFEMIIFDRWGNEVFRTNDQKEAWTGGINGYYVPDGVYTYMITALDLLGLPISEDITITGIIYVLR